MWNWWECSKSQNPVIRSKGTICIHGTEQPSFTDVNELHAACVPSGLHIQQFETSINFHFYDVIDNTNF